MTYRKAVTGFLFVVFAIGTVSMLSMCHDGPILGMDYRIFKDTPAWELAQAVRDEDTVEIRELVQANPASVNYQDPTHRHTLLQLSIMNANYPSFRTLLKMGADVHLRDAEGESAVIDASQRRGYTDTSTAYLELLLQHGANPNGERAVPDTGNLMTTPLIRAASDMNLRGVRLLVEAGANVNDTTRYGGTALEAATVFDSYDIVLYLLEHGVDPRGKNINTMPDMPPRYLWNHMREALFPLGSQRYQDKMRVAQYLKEHGIADYWQVPIDEYTMAEIKKEYPDTWQEYVKKY